MLSFIPIFFFFFFLGKLLFKSYFFFGGGGVYVSFIAKLVGHGLDTDQVELGFELTRDPAQSYRVGDIRIQLHPRKLSGKIGGSMNSLQ